MSVSVNLIQSLKVSRVLGVCFVVGTLVLVGCGVPAVVAVDHLNGPGVDEPFPGAVMTRLRVDFDRVVYDFPRAVKKTPLGCAGC